MLRSFVLLVACYLLNLLSAPFVSAQADACSQRAISVFAKDTKGQPIAGLRPADLEGKVLGRPVKILSIAPDARPHRLVLIVDTSQSIYHEGEPPRWRWEIGLARHFFDQHSQRAQISLLIFSKQANEVVDFSQGNSAVNHKLQEAFKSHGYLRKSPKGPKTLYEAISRGLQMFDRPSSADAIYVLTDGGDYNDSTHGTSEVIQPLLATGVRLFAVLLQGESSFVRKTAEEMLGPEQLAQVARKSGGVILSTAEWHGDRVSLSANPDGKTTAQETLTRLYQPILEDSVLEIELPFPIEKNERLELKLSNEARRQWNGAQIIYSDNLIRCAPNSTRK